MTQFWYDWRDRQAASEIGVGAAAGTHPPITLTSYDNLGEATLVQQYDGNVSSVSVSGGTVSVTVASSPALVAQTRYAYDSNGQLYQTQVYSVDPSTGTASTTSILTTNYYRDLDGQLVAQSNPGGQWNKYVYDGAGRVIAAYITDGSWYGDAFSVDDDEVLQETDTTYDKDGNAILVVTKQRFDSDAYDSSAGWGALGTPTTGVLARVYYVAYYYNEANQLIGTVNVGTNGGAAWTRPSTLAANVASNTVLVTSQGTVEPVAPTEENNSAVYSVSQTDPLGITTITYYDALGEVVETAAGVGTPNLQITQFGYDGDGNRTAVKAFTQQNGQQQIQVTRYIYQARTTGVNGSAINSNDVLTAIQYPNPVSGQPDPGQQQTYTVNAQGQNVTFKDRNGVVHQYTYDALGRQIQDRASVIPSSDISSLIQAIVTTYNAQGQIATVASVNLMRQNVSLVTRLYNGFGQIVKEYQWQTSDGSSLGRFVQYNYTFTGNNSRLTSIVYPLDSQNPGGYTIYYNYTSGLDNAINRVTSISVGAAAGSSGAIILEQDKYLGLNTVVQRDYPQAHVMLTYIQQTGETSVLSDGGDKYTGLDRFGRVIDQLWTSDTSFAVVDRVQYAYDADSNIVAARVLTPGGANFSDLYVYNSLNQIATFTQGTLASGSNTIVGRPRVFTNYNLNSLGDPVGGGSNALNQVPGVGQGGTKPIAYDKNGNVVEELQGNKILYLIYDAWNRLTGVNTPNLNGRGDLVMARYAYDGLNRLIANTAPLRQYTMNLYYNVNGQLLSQQMPNGTSATQDVWSPAGTNTLTKQGSQYVVQDPMGSVTALLSSAGVVQQRFVYSPFGAVTPLTNNFGSSNISVGNPPIALKVLFQGLAYDTRSYFYVAAGRWLDPILGRWLQPGGGDLNMYRFAGGDPANLADSPPPLTLNLTYTGQTTVWDSTANFIGVQRVLSWNNIGGNKRDWIGYTSDFSAAIGDTVSMGLTQRFRTWLGYNDVVDPNSGFYLAGQVAGTVVNVGLAFANPCTLLQSGTTLGLLAYRGLQVINGVQALGGAFNFGSNLAQGNYGMAALDALGIFGNLSQMLRACFEPDVPTETKDGVKIIDDVIPLRDYVLSRNENDPNGPVEWKLVLRKFERWAYVFKLHLEEGRVLGTTSEHPFYKEGAGWVPCGELLPGDRIWTKELRWVGVVEVFNTQEIRRVINLQVEDFATFFVGGEDWGFSVWAHNTYQVTTKWAITRWRQDQTKIIRVADQMRQAGYSKQDIGRWVGEAKDRALGRLTGRVRSRDLPQWPAPWSPNYPQ